MQHEITERTLLLDKRGRIAQPGWSRQMNYVYNRERAHINPVNLKEWNFYQFIKDHTVVQLTIGHVSYALNAAVTVLDLDTGKRLLDWSTTQTPPFFRKPKLDRAPNRPGSIACQGGRGGKYELCFQVTEKTRRLAFGPVTKQEETFEDGIHVDILTQNNPNNEKMVIATPFEESPYKFYLNYKENFYRTLGSVSIPPLCQIDLTGATGVLDWGRGIWPYRHEWWWGNLSARVNGEDFGFNIGWGFGDLSHATENVYFYKRKACKLGRLQIQRDGDYMDPWHIKDDEEKIELHFHPIYDNYTERKLAVVDTSCHQVFGLFDGWAETEDGRIEFHDLLAFIEHAVNRW